MVLNLDIPTMPDDSPGNEILLQNRAVHSPALDLSVGLQYRYRS